MSAPRLRRPRVRTVAAVAGLATAGLLLAGCADWWTPQYSKTEFAPPTSAATETAAALSEQPTFGVTVDDFAEQWNAAAAELGVDLEMPSPLVADDTTDGVGTTTLIGGADGDDIVTVQWVDETSELTFVQLDLTYLDVLTDSAEQDLIAVAIAATTGQSPTDAAAAAADLVVTATDGDPNSAGGQTTSIDGDAAIDLNFIPGSATVLISPAEAADVDVDSSDDSGVSESPSPEASAS